MPRIKEVDSLQELANHVLFSSLIQCCQRHSGRGRRALTRLRKVVGAIRETILDRFPSNLKADFLANLMNSCVSFLRDESQGTAILEMIMDIDIVGLRLTGQIVRFLKPDQAPRFRKLKELDLSHARGINVDGNYEYERRPVRAKKFHPDNDTSDDEDEELFVDVDTLLRDDEDEELFVDVDTLLLNDDTSDDEDEELLVDVAKFHLWDDTSAGDDADLPVNLGKFQLNDVTSLKYPNKCTDSDLEIIGLNCPNLEVLDVYNSESVTDAGMRFLSTCPNLRVVKVDHCPKVTYVTLSSLLSGHNKLEDFSYGYDEKYREPIFCQAGYTPKRRLEFNMLSGLDFTLQCPYLTRFIYENDQDFSPAVEMKAIVTKFPNLTHFTIKCIQVENLSAVKHLTKLTELRVEFNKKPRFDTRAQSWLSLQEALTVIGANLTSLTLHDGSLLVQDDVNFIFESCPNLEHLQVDHSPDEATRTLPFFIPPFPKLKELVFFPREHHRSWGIAVDEPLSKFGDLLNLEVLSVLFMRIDSSFLESIMLDNVKFPKLRVVKINSVKPEDLAKIEQTARENNLDFCTPDDGSEPYYPYDIDCDSDSIDNYDYGVDNDCEFWHDYSD